MNYADGGGLPRSLLDFGQQIDRWQSLGLPLLVQLAMPAASGEDALATRAGTVVPLGSNGMTTPELQARTAMRWIKTMLAKGGVHGVIWEGWDDRFPHAMPHSGLIDRDGQPRPLLHAITQLRSELLK